jgi:hypothetical protein
MGSCEWVALHRQPHNCSLPGGPTDPDLHAWIATVRSAALQAKRQGLNDVSFDVWNEPNGQAKVECMTTDKCVYDANLTQTRFFALWDTAHAAVRQVLPTARMVGPSLADGGPGQFGFTRTVLPWLQVPTCLFLLLLFGLTYRGSRPSCCTRMRRGRCQMC